MIKVVTLSSIHPSDGGEFFVSVDKFEDVAALEQSVETNQRSEYLLVEDLTDSRYQVMMDAGIKECTEYQTNVDVAPDNMDAEVAEFKRLATGAMLYICWSVEYDVNVSAIFADEDDLGALLSSNSPAIRELGRKIVHRELVG